MSKFNQTSAVNTNKTVNLAGGVAYDNKNLKEKLALQALTTFVNEAKYYGDNTPDIKKNIQSILAEGALGAQFVRNLGLFARKEFNLRSISHLIAGELASNEVGNTYTKEYVSNVCVRPDDMLEIVSLHRTLNNNKVANSVKKGIAEAIHKFDQYQLSKYKGKRKALKMKDIINVAHPKPKNEVEAALYKSILEDTITTPYTWETTISAIKKCDTAAVKKAWEGLITSKNEKGMFVLPIMALLRNLNNILKADVSSQAIEVVISRLTDEKTIVNSRQLPFRFYSAYKVLTTEFAYNPTQGVAKVLRALETSIQLSVVNMPKFEGKTCIVVDESGSMDGLLADKSSISYKELGNLFTAICVAKGEEVTVIPFGEKAKKMYLSSNDSIFTNMNKLRNSGVGYATYLTTAFDLITEQYDRIIVFSDMQTYTMTEGYAHTSSKGGDLFAKYSSKYKECYLHSFDLAGYRGTSPFDMTKPKVSLYGGWSDKSLSLISLSEKGISSLVKEIENYVV
jgi:hypothetical protein